MGAWDTGIFDDDTACDVLASLALADPFEQIGEWFDAVADADYLEYTDGQCVLVSCAVIDAALNGTVHPCDDPDTLAAVVDTVRQGEPTSLKATAVLLLQRLLGDASELRELWEENDALFPAWRANVTALLERLR